MTLFEPLLAHLTRNHEQVVCGRSLCAGQHVEIHIAVGGERIVVFLAGWKIDHNGCRVHIGKGKETTGVHREVQLPADGSLGRIVTTVALFSVSLADWLSMTATVSPAALPSSRRAWSRSASCTRCQVPSSRHSGR